MKKSLFILTFLAIYTYSIAQTNYTAKDSVAPYEGYFRPGANLDYYPPWDDKELANIAAGNPALGINGVGVKSIRPTLPGHFVEQWGYDSRVDEYQHYYSVDLKELTNIVGFPSPQHRDQNYYCQTQQSEMFANLYEDIWDDGENGTPVNDDNYYALYLYKVVTQYKDYVKFWEIWNEPGLDYTGNLGWRQPGDPVGNWWDNNPDPCDYKLRAPIYHYIRTLRISWEIIKTFDPDSYVTVAGVGFTSFLDAVLRNTDNPVDGTPTDEYPHGGGAYFDVMGFHSYPHFDGSLRYWDNDIFGFVNTRHSDLAAAGILRRQNQYQAVLNNYGFDGVTYPKKEWIITEINVPRKSYPYSFGYYIGGEDAQVNFIIKAVVTCMKNGIRQMHVYKLSEGEEIDFAPDEFDVMGLYKKIEGNPVYSQEINKEGIAYKTASDRLFERRYDEAKTMEMALPDGVDGGAFVDDNGTYTYVLWGKTSVDSSEVVETVYSFPVSFDLSSVTKKEWDFSQTFQEDTISSQGILLTATPIFIKETQAATGQAPSANFSASTTGGCLPLSVSFTDLSSDDATSWSWDLPGSEEGFSVEQNPTVTYNTPGVYPVTLTASNLSGFNTFEQTSYITVTGTPSTNFSSSITDLTTSFTNQTTNANSYEWNFGDGNVSSDANPTHSYASDGVYTVTLNATNECGTTNSIETLTIITVPSAAFTTDASTGCIPFNVNFTNQSSSNATDYEWSFEGGTPSSSTDINPSVTYETPGVYSVTLVASNAAGNTTVEQMSYIIVGNEPTTDFSTNISNANVTFSNQSTNANSYVWNFGDGNSSSDASPTHSYSEDGIYTVSLAATNDCGTVTSNETITIVTPPEASFSSNATVGCADFEVSFIDESSDNTTAWAWSFPGATPNTSAEQNPTVTYNTPGVYSVSLVTTNAAGNNTSLQDNYIIVQGPPTAGFVSGVAGNSANFNNTSTSANAYTWDFGDGNNSTDANPMHQYDEPGTYTVTLTAINDCGTTSIAENITIIAAPTAGFTADITTGCTPFVVTFTDQSANVDNWIWSFPGGIPATSVEQNPTVSYNSPGTYSVSLEVSNAVGGSSVAQNSYITVADEPTASFEFGLVDAANVNFNNTSLNADSYQWNFGDGTTSIDPSPSHTYSENGEYTVQLISTNACDTDTSEQVIVIQITATNDIDFIEEVALYPNPNNGQFTLAMRGQGTEELQINFFNILGQKMFQEKIDFRVGFFVKQFDLNHLANGTYILQVQSADGQLHRKVVIDK